MITPKEGFMYYKKFLDYIGHRLGRKVKFIDKESYIVINDMLESGDIDVAFICPGPYVDGHEKFDMELLVAPKAYGDTVYYSYIIAHKDSSIKSFEDLRGKKFAFTDPLSNTGKLVPTYLLSRMQESPKTFFGSCEFTYAHDKSIQAVAEGIVDGAAVDSLIWEYANRINPEFTSKTTIVRKSDPYGIPPVVVRPGLDPSLKKKLKEIFLLVHENKEGREILKGMMIDKFVAIDNSHYDSIREMKQFLANNNESKG
jgi:phosphonate transport system substrate-binding protein